MAHEPHVVIAGASGLIGSALARSLQNDRIAVTRLVRRPARGPGEVEWLTGSPLDPAVLEGARAVVGLNGASIGKLPWGSKYRRELTQSRLEPTRALATAVRALGAEAPAFLSGSAVGYYGNQPGARLDESGARGDTFLARLCSEWEAAAVGAGSNARVVLLRTSPLLHRRGVLKPLIRLTRAGIAGPLGRGTQVWPWISLADEVRAIRHLIESWTEGPVNLAGPSLGSANDIGRDLARAMRRPFFVPAPAWALRLGLGRDAADSLLLPDAAVEPRALAESGFTFTHETHQQAIAAALKDDA